MSTIIEGAGPKGNNAVRCVWLGENATIEGFTLTNGHTRTSGGIDGGAIRRGHPLLRQSRGHGDLQLRDPPGCEARYHGGGAFKGTL